MKKIFNYLICILFMGCQNPIKFSEDIFSPRRITWATILIILGYIVELFAIMHIKKD